MSKQQRTKVEAAGNGRLDTSGHGSPPGPSAHTPAPERRARRRRGLLGRLNMGPALTLALIIGAELIHRAGVDLPDITAVLLIGVIVSVFTGNLVAVLLSATMAMAYSVWSLPPHGTAALLRDSQIAILSDAIVVFTVAWLGLWLRRNLEEATHLGSLNTKLNEQLHRTRAQAIEAQNRIDDLEDFVEQAAIGLHRVNPEGRILWANQAELDLLGYTREEYIGRHIADFHADEDIIADILTRLTAGEELHAYEAPLRRKDGSILHVLITSNVMRRNGEFIHTRCFTRDITDRKLAELKLQDRERTLDLIFRRSSEAVYVTDDEGRYLDVNDFGLKLLGYERDELLQMSVADVVFPADAEDASEAIDEIGSGQDMKGTWRLRKRDGGAAIVEYSAARLDTNRLVSFVRDITEREQLADSASAMEAEAQRAMEFQQAHFNLSRLLTGTDSVLGSAPAVLGLLAQHIDAQVASLWLIGEQGSLRSSSTYLSDAAAYNEFGEITSNIVLKSGSGMAGRAVKSMRPEWVYDIASDTNFPRAPYAQRAGLLSACAVPVIGAGGIVGVIDFMFSSQSTANADTVAFLEDAAHRIGILIEREQALQALRESAQRSLALFEQAGAGVAQTDVDGSLLAVNQQLSEMLGYPREELLGRSLREFAHPQDVGRYVLNLGLLWAGDLEHMKQELRFRRADGEEIWTALSVSVVRDDDGSARYTVAVMQDVTEQFRAREAVREQQEYLRAVIDNSPMTLAAVDTSGVYQLYIGNALEPLGVTVDDRLGHTIYEAHADTPQTLQAYEKALAGETVSYVRRELGLDFTFLITPHVDSNGAVIGAVALATDITSQQQAKEALQASEERFKRLLYALPTAIYTTDNAGVITLFNEQAVELWGREPELGKELWCGSWKIYHPDGSAMDLDECPMARTLRSGKGIRGEEIVVERPDGTRRHVLPYPEPLYDSSGELIGAVNMLVDITDRKASEDRLRTAELRLQAMLQFAPLILIEIDKQGIVELIIGSGLSETDTDASANVGTSVYEQNRDKPDRIALFERALAGEIVDTVLIEGEMAFKTLMAPKHDADGELAGVIAVLTSVSDLYRAQRALETSEEQYRDLVQTSQDLIFSIDADGRWSFVNDAAEAVFGYTAAEMIGKYYWETLPEEIRAAAQEAHRDIGPGQSWVQYEQRHISRDGRPVDLLFTSKVRSDAEGTVTGISGTAVDVTARNRAEHGLLVDSLAALRSEVSQESETA